ncbi:MAG: methyltransferase domain-containing protein [Dehalococcoidales bacterium]|nr:methyltransferase domain-containing protein [Dehalococcoidales bacterium]
MTENVFDRIAPGWYGFRHHTIFRTELETLAKKWQPGKLLNIGCAHGPDFIPFREHFELYGIDSSPEMLHYGRKYARKFDFEPFLELADATSLPFPDNSFDYAIAVATYHHLEDKTARLKALRELNRVLKPDGEAFITVWNHWQPRFWFKGSDTLVPWRIKEQVVQRYYHLFSYGEMAKLVKQAGLQVIKLSPESSHRCPIKYFSRNICLLVKKISNK